MSISGVKLDFQHKLLTPAAKSPDKLQWNQSESHQRLFSESAGIICSATCSARLFYEAGISGSRCGAG